MDELLREELFWVIISAGGLIGIFVMVKIPELAIAFLLVGQDFIQFAMRIIGVNITRRDFTFLGAAMFLPIVGLMLLGRLMVSGERKPLIGKPNQAFLLVVLILGAWVAVGVSYTLGYRTGSAKALHYFVFGVTPLLLTWLFVRDLASAKRLLFWIILVSIAYVGVVSGYSLATRGTLLGHFVSTAAEERRSEMSMDITGNIALGIAIVASISCLLTLAAGRKALRWKVLAIMSMPIAIFYSIGSGSRSNLVVLSFISMFGFWFAFKGQRGLLLVAFCIVIVCVAGMYVTATEDVQEKIFSAWFDPTTQSGQSAESRIEYMRGFPRHFERAPIIGSGTGAWPVLHHGRDVYFFPHNMFIEITVENGLIGLGLLVTLWVIIFRRVFHVLKNSVPGTALYGMAVFGVCRVMTEFLNGLAHSGIATSSNTILLSSAIVLRFIYLAEDEQLSRQAKRETVGYGESMLVRPVIGMPQHSS